jgi:hypothetical protein
LLVDYGRALHNQNTARGLHHARMQPLSCRPLHSRTSGLPQADGAQYHGAWEGGEFIEGRFMHRDGSMFAGTFEASKPVRCAPAFILTFTVLQQPGRGYRFVATLQSVMVATRSYRYLQQTVPLPMPNSGSRDALF